MQRDTRRFVVLGAVAVAVTAVVLGAIWLAWQGDDAQQFAALNHGQDLLQQRRFRQCADEMEKTVQRWPDSVAAHYLLGRACWGQDRRASLSVNRAIEAFARAAELDPAAADPISARALEQLAFACVHHERLTEAADAFQKLLQGDIDADRRRKFQGQIDEIDLDQGVYQRKPDDRVNERGEVIQFAPPGNMQTNQWYEKARHTNDPAKWLRWYTLATQSDQAYSRALQHRSRSVLAWPV